MSELFVDQPQNVIAAPDTWYALSYNHLLETKIQIMDKIYLARGKPVYLKPLHAAVARLDELIALKLSDPRGLS